ncbi:MAG TPA: serine/threonine-protein kinase [Gemmatimonadaceae bacterium]|nr:serine/threonine-protein kinase [Gemmatimonadaceae bacterium]
MSSLHQVLQAAVGPAFQIGRELQGAGMSRVFLAREPALGRDVVVKVLPPDLVSSTSLQRFTREVEVTARLQHPHILPIITAGGNDELRFYITPFIRGESLRTRLAGETVPFAEAVRIADQLLNAIAFAHARGVIHRDIKPGNILLSEGHAILADFGIATILEAGQPADFPDRVTGSTLDSARIYVAPEQPRDEQRDLFAAAVVIHEIATGVPGAAGLSATSITSAVRARHPRAPVGDVRKLAAILSRGLAVDPASRYLTAADFRSAIHSIGRASRRPVLVGMGVGGVAAILTLSMFALSRPETETPSLLLQSGPAPASSVSGDSTGGQPDVVPTSAKEAEAGLVTRPARPPKAPLDSATDLFRRGDLGGAREQFQAAVTHDAADARAQLGVAITAGMMDTPVEQEAARIAGQRALAATPALDVHDRSIAEGFVALADRRYPDACAAFRRARDVRPTFEAWYGLGECAARDDLVIVDANGAANFRSGYASAFTAFASAARAAAPNAPLVVYRRLMQTVPQTSADIRMGRTADGRMYVGQWRLLGDTLGSVLAPSGPRAVSPDAFTAAAVAARVGREALRPLLLAWVARSPEDPAAHEALALLLENTGVIAEEGDDRVSALSAMARARKLERAPGASLRMASAHARLMLRAKQYGPLADLADSVLTANSDEKATEVEPLIPLALLTGRIERATSLVARASGVSGRQVRGADSRPVRLPTGVLRERADFLVRASLGVCDARVKSAPKRMIDLLDASFPGGVPRGFESSFMERIVAFALPCLGPSVLTTLREPGRSLPMWARAFDPADTAFAGEYAIRERARPAHSPGSEAGVDGVILESSVKLALGDSVGALRMLTLALDRIPVLGRGALMSEWSVGATTRGMALAAETAAGLGDRETAHRWSTAVVTLWRNADPELRPQVERLRAIARATADASRRE